MGYRSRHYSFVEAFLSDTQKRPGRIDEAWGIGPAPALPLSQGNGGGLWASLEPGTVSLRAEIVPRGRQF